MLILVFTSQQAFSKSYHPKITVAYHFVKCKFCEDASLVAQK